jgi:hypothetical protein
MHKNNDPVDVEKSNKKSICEYSTNILTNFVTLMFANVTLPEFHIFYIKDMHSDKMETYDNVWKVASKQETINHMMEHSISCLEKYFSDQTETNNEWTNFLKYYHNEKINTKVKEIIICRIHEILYTNREIIFETRKYRQDVYEIAKKVLNDNSYVISLEINDETNDDEFYKSNEKYYFKIYDELKKMSLIRGDEYSKIIVSECARAFGEK